MMKKWIVVLFILMCVSVGNAIETAERISDREIIEGLATLKEGLRSINQRLDDFKEGQKSLKEDISNLRDFMTWGFGVVFVSIFSLAGFVLWDRRSALAPAVRKNKELEEREEVLERWKKMVDVALRELAGGDVKVANVLRHVGLL